MAEGKHKPSPWDLESQAATDVLTERRRQIEAEGYSLEHDDGHKGRELARAAACYALNERHLQRPKDLGRFAGDFAERLERVWPWKLSPKPGINPDFLYETWKPNSARRNLVKAGALILAEIERLDRLPASAASSDTEGA